MAQKFNVNKPLGIGIGVWGANMLEADQMPQFWKDLNPQMKAAALIFAGDFLPKQKFVKNMIKQGEMREGIGAGFQAVGIQTLLEEFNVISGIGQGRSLRDDDILAVAIEGDDYGYDDDLEIVNDDVLADEYDYDWEEMGDDDDDDLDIVNDDVLAYDDEEEDDDDDTIWD